MKTIPGRKFNRTVTILFWLMVFLFLPPNLFAQTKILSGSWSVSPSFPDYSLDDNNGDRSMTIEIKFDNPFISKPDIFLSVTQIDADKETNVRYNVEVISVSRDGFTIKVRTWSDSKIFSISGYWLGIAE